MDHLDRVGVGHVGREEDERPADEVTIATPRDTNNGLRPRRCPLKSGHSDQLAISGHSVPARNSRRQP